MKLLLLHSAKYKLFPSKLKLPRHPFLRLPPFPSPLTPSRAADNNRPNSTNKKKKTPDLSLTVEKIEEQSIRALLLPSPTSHLLDILDDAALFHPNILHSVLSIFRADPARRRLSVQGLPPGATAEGLRGFFSRFGAVEEAEVAAARGCGHVVLGSVEAVLGALKASGGEIEEGLGGGCYRVWEECDGEEWRRRGKGGCLGHVPLRRVLFVPVVYH